MTTLTENRPSLFSRLQWNAIRIGISEGDKAIVRTRRFGFLWLFSGSRALPLANKSLEVLRAWTEMARIFLVEGKALSTSSLVDAGYSPRQIAELQRLMAAMMTNEIG